MKLKYIIRISAVVAICTSCSKSSGIDKKEQADKVVGIAWREDSDYVPHDVSVAPGSLLAEFTGAATITNVPSWHHQSMSAVDESCLKVTGTTLTNGFDFIEAIERTDCSLAIGLQFHPEVSIVKHVNKSPNESNYMNYIQAQSIFRNFVNKAAK